MAIPPRTAPDGRERYCEDKCKGTKQDSNLSGGHNRTTAAMRLPKISIMLLSPRQ